MPKGPRGERRPADVVGNAVHVMRIATGEIEDTATGEAKAYSSKGGRKGGRARALALTPEQRADIAKAAAAARWKKSDG
ncbi:MAG: RNA-binding protein [Bauldia sp.]|nr:RNA-binding protein [Bauldia sp.]